MRPPQTDLSVYSKFDFEKPPVGVKFLFEKPEGIARLDKKLGFCEMLKEAHERDTAFYFDKDNSHKELKELIEHFEEKGYSVYMREVKYGMDDNEYIYEVHIIA